MCVFSQVLLQPQFIKAESLLLTTLKHDPCIVTTMPSTTSLATTTPVQSTSLQVIRSAMLIKYSCDLKLFENQAINEIKILCQVPLNTSF